MLSVDPGNEEILEGLTKLALDIPGLDDMPLLIHAEAQFADAAVQANVLRTLRVDEPAITRHPYPMAQQFVSRLFTLGHVKSSRPQDEIFAEYFVNSPKWLRVGAWD